MTPLRFPKRGVPRDRSTFHLQARSPKVLPSVQLGLVLTLHRLSPFVLGLPSLPLLLSPFLRPDLPLFQVFNHHFLLQIGIGLQSEVDRELRRRRRRKIGGNLGFGGLLGG